MRNYVVCHYAKCYGPPVNYTTHIERKTADGTVRIPYNIKRSDLTRHNREFITEARKTGRTAAIEKRLMAVKYQTDKDGNEYERKIRKDQVCCIEIRLSASPEAMAEIIAQGRLMDWCRESVKWAQREHGKENIVSAVLHMDEETPHLHVSLVPVVQGESKKQATTKKRAAKDKEKAESDGTEPPKKKRRYKKKADASTLRLCADDIMTQSGLKRYQTEYAAAMEQFGLRRGEEGSPARHKDLAQYYKDHCEEMHARLDEVLAELAKVENLLVKKDAEIESRDKVIRQKEDEISGKESELAEKNREIVRQQRELEELKPKVEEERSKFDTLFSANEYLEGVELSADRLLASYDSREKEVLRIEREALERINQASISFLAKKDVERLAKENAGLKLLVSGKDSEIQKERNETEKERKAREKAEADKKQLEKTVSGVHSALERRHPEETRLLRELVTIGVSDPKCQDYILNGGSVTFEPYPWKDPSNGKRIPEEYCQEVIIKKEGNGNDSFISMCGMRIADFFKQIWAKVTEALGLKKKQEEEQRRQQKPESPRRGMKM
ncbi:MobV family relaxase [uncultured Bacteroides sp.]|uniref:MobV family relaxase n=1 Tax=uncultured Bacteroides sp. TaxID=162156 RepID=UPI0025B5C466|nr:MobV family relaxase [uncultured Bacteroides sp.]